MQRVLITGGPTRSYLDRVRFLTNFSSGEVAYELCRELARKEIPVHAVIGPSEFPFEKLPIELTRVVSTAEMHEAVMRQCRRFSPTHAIFSAAVLDFEPVRREPGKVSSTKARWTITLKPTPKIIDEVGRRFPKVKRFGFKLEWAKPAAAVRRKIAAEIIQHKKLDGLCLNFLPEIDDKKHLALVATPTGEFFEVHSKRDIAKKIVALLSSKQ